ncbi:hypothetical protein FOC4_g10010039 [Fusarium odoratissimum]|uniref:NAD(P)-binding domain-containing protein n=1 Tax=Fusarium oxysporum f. sp. cubense (strain race 4) TaxID=2502994 RepID=N1S0D8_FUSC4|nr:hypothetical protein FOC4_g10010039 [Fusarium odoratissimum]
MSSVKAIIFGATGAVGRAAVLEAQSRGAPADLSDPKSAQRAVSKSGATVAFSYILFEAEDGLLGTHKAIKRAGITHAVLLFSFCVRENGGPKPSSEARNTQMLEDWEEVKSGQLELAHPDAPFDYLAPEDVAALAGARVAATPPSGELVISQCGTELLSQHATWKVVSEVWVWISASRRPTAMSTARNSDPGAFQNV